MGEPLKADQVIDARGVLCPGPLMELMLALRANPPRTVIEVLCSDETSVNDICQWVTKSGHELLGTQPYEGHFGVTVRKAGL
jgi:TusA-related sulfurtransferase